MTTKRHLLQHHHDRRTFYEGLRINWLPVLTKYDFRGKGWYCSRIKEPCFNAVCINEAENHTGCFVELGFHLTFLRDVFGKRASISDLRQGMWGFREELHRDRGDRFWPFRQSRFWEVIPSDRQVDRVVKELVEAFATRGLQMYEEFNSLSDLLAITIDDIRNERSVKFCGKLTVGWAYYLAQIHRHVGNIESSQALAQFGLECVGARPSRNERPLVDRFKELMD